MASVAPRDVQVIRKNFFTGRVVKHWSREVEESSPLEVFRKMSGMCRFQIWFSGPGSQLGQRLMILEVFYDLNDSIILGSPFLA